MSMAYCKDCLEREDVCECENPSNEVVYGELRREYLRGYRDAKEGKECLVD